MRNITMNRKRIVVGISGASGAVYGIELLRFLKTREDIESHLIISRAARSNIELETSSTPDEVEAIADSAHRYDDLTDSLASGSFLTHGMVIAPCSIKTLSGVANSYEQNLMIRAAGVALKERRTLVLLVRETPLHLGHLRLMTRAAEMGAIILPPVPAFYHKPKTIDDIVRQTVGKVLDQLGIEHELFERWG